MTRFYPAAILLISLVLRVVLALQGGQYFFGDEGRYDRGIELYRDVTQGKVSTALAVAAQPEHTLFPWVGAVVSAAQHGLARFTDFGDWSRPENAGFTIGLGAAVLSLFSTLNLFLLYRLARRAGAIAEEATWALLLMATANAAFYHARHLLPYDCALSAALAALVVAFGRPTLLRAACAGLLTGACYHLYNGYWFLVPVVSLVLFFRWWAEARRVGLIGSAAVGVLVALGLPVGLGLAVGGGTYWATLRAFSGTVTQGLFAEGWSLPWEYLWHSEGVIGPALLVVVLIAVVHARRLDEPLPDRVRAALLALGVAYALLVLLSCGLGRFVVYARTVKPFVPALCLLGGWALARQFASNPVLKPLAVAVLLVAGAQHLAPHFGRVFPREMEISVLREWGNPKRALTVTGSLYTPVALPVKRTNLALIDAQFLYPVRGAFPAPPGTDLLRFEHPLAYKPYQYEGHTPRERALLRSTEIDLRLIHLTTPEIVPDNPPPALLYRNEDRPTGR